MIPYDLMMAQPPLYTGAVSVYPWNPLVARRYTVPGRYEDTEPMRLWSRVGEDQMGLPWNCCPPGEDDRRSNGWAINVKHKIIPRTPDQARVQSEARALMQQGRSFVIQSPTGTGKTVTALRLFAELGRSTVVIVPKEDLLEQWVDRALQFTSLKKEDIGRIQGDTIQVKGRPLVLGSLQSLAKDGRYPPWVYEHFGLIIFDEVHRLGADLFGEVARKFTARHRLGLSATPTRKDGKDLIIEAHIGPIAVVGKDVAMESKAIIIQTPWRCPRNKMGERIPHKPGRIAHIIKSLQTSGVRNSGICTIAAAGHQKGRQIVMFAHHVEHLEMLGDMLPGFGVRPNEIGRYYGQFKEDQRPVTLATYGKMGEGTDIPRLDMCMLLTPTADPTQPVGRVVRPFPGKPMPLTFDFVDADSPVLLNYAKSRLKTYKKIKAEIVEADFPT